MGIFSKKDKSKEAKDAKSGGLFKFGSKKKQGGEVVAVTATADDSAVAEAPLPAPGLEASASVVEPCVEDSAALAAAAAPSVELNKGRDTLALAMGLPLARKPSTPVCTALKGSFKFFSISGAGFVQAAEVQPELVVHLLEVGREAIKASEDAKANRQNCLALAAFLRDAVECLDQHGRQFSQLPEEKLCALLEAFKGVASLIGDASVEGWVLHLVYDKAPKPEAFVELSSSILEIVQGCVPAHSNRRLKMGDYRDVAKQFKRLVKQQGAGSVVAGMRQIQADEKALEEAAQLLGVETQELLEEIESCDVEAAAAGAGGAGGILFDGPIRDRECVAVFNAYVSPGSPTISRDGFAQLLEDLGALSVEDSEQFVDQQFSQAAAGGKLTFAAFSDFYLAQPLSLHRQHIRAELGVEAERKLHSVFSTFASFGTGSTSALDSFRFSKLVKDCGLLGPELSAQQVDIIFTQAKPKDGRKLDFDGLVAALALVAKQTGTSLEGVVNQVLAAEGPAVNGTQAEFNKFHDDKSQYTGVYARGGPSVVDRTMDPAAAMVSRADDASSPQLASLNLSRANSSARGTPATSATSTPTAAAAAAKNPLRLALHKMPGGASAPASKPAAATAAGRKAAPAPAAKAASASQRPRSAQGQGVSVTPPPRKSPSKVASHMVTPSAFAGTPGAEGTPAYSGGHKAELRKVFQEYASFGTGAAGGEAGLDGARFAKLCRETGLLTKSLNNTRVDLIFAKVSGKARRITFAQFLGSLERMAEARRCSVDDVVAIILASEGPQRKGTTPDAVRFYDDKSLWGQGVHAHGGPSTVNDQLSPEALVARPLSARGRPSPRPSLG